MKNITLPLNAEIIKTLKAGDIVNLSGEFFTARDAAHKRLFDMLMRGEPLPVDLSGATVYYVGPSPGKTPSEIGACGPTTSARMDKYTPALLGKGMLGMIGKGGRSSEVTEAMAKCGAVYFAAVGGAGALYSSCVKSFRLLAFPDLGSEAVYSFTVKDFPVIVAVDSYGNSIYTI